MRLLVQAYSGVADALRKINNETLRSRVLFYLYILSIPRLSYLAMLPPKAPIISRGPVDPNAKKAPSKMPTFVTTGSFAIQDF